MLKKNVLIKMQSIQMIGNDEKTETTLTTEGTLDLSENSAVISYEDSDATGFKGSVTTITVKEGRLASILRSGSSNSNLIIETGKKHFCHYETPFGSMVVGINTKMIKNNIDVNGGNLEMKYTVDVNSSYVSDNEILLDICPLN